MLILHSDDIDDPDDIDLPWTVFRSNQNITKHPHIVIDVLLEELC